MQDMRAHMEKLKSEAEYCALISELAVDPQKRVLFRKPLSALEATGVRIGTSFQDKVEKEEG